MAKRPQFSRWRRLPGVYRFGSDKPADPGLDPQRVSLYIAGNLIDAADAQARRLGYQDVQLYCEALLVQAIEDEQAREQVADVEARQGPLEGFHEISEDPAYLAELRAAKGPRRETPHPSGPMNSEALSVPIRFLSDEARNDGIVPEVVEEPGPASEPSIVDVEYAPTATPTEAGLPAAQPRPTGELSHPAQVVLRHAGFTGDDPSAFLPSLRRGAGVNPSEVAELAQALNDLEREFRGCRFLDRDLGFALHRLAYESQILHTDAWPGVFDVWTVDMLRAVQESVERILSGRDIRYYPTSGPEATP